MEITIPENTKNADYYFPADGIVAELKTLTKSHGERGAVFQNIKTGLKKNGYPESRFREWIEGQKPLPQKVSRYVDQKVQNSIKHAVRKANSQILQTKRLVENPQAGILIVANLHETLFGPIEMLQYFAKHALERSNPSIDAVLLITPGVKYSSGFEPPKHYVAPAYGEGKQYLGDFIEPLVTKWLKFEAKHLGVKLDVEIARSIDQDSLNARPMI